MILERARMLEVPKPYFGDCDEFLSDEEYFLKQRAKEISDDNYLEELWEEIDCYD